MSKPTVEKAANFLRPIVQADLDSGKHTKIITRFPPEPNGYLHIGHAKSICLNFGLAQEFGGECNLRFDDTNPAKEDQEYIDAIKADVEWLGFKWAGQERYASDYFDQLHEWAIHLIQAGKAFVCDLNAEQMRAYRGSLTEP
ncbi:glutamate--tRNA ligase family protein, partial [Stutzerimonas balearica]